MDAALRGHKVPFKDSIEEKYTELSPEQKKKIEDGLKDAMARKAKEFQKNG